jgi:hypothetical protein
MGDIYIHYVCSKTNNSTRLLLQKLEQYMYVYTKGLTENVISSVKK